MISWSESRGRAERAEISQGYGFAGPHAKKDEGGTAQIADIVPESAKASDNISTKSKTVPTVAPNPAPNEESKPSLNAQISKTEEAAKASVPVETPKPAPSEPPPTQGIPPQEERRPVVDMATSRVPTVQPAYGKRVPLSGQPPSRLSYCRGCGRH